MASKTALLTKLQGTAPKPKLIIDQQQVKDIMAGMLVKHEACKADYDLIYRDFLGGDIWDICERLFNFCVDNIKINTETEKKQYVSCPYTILERGSSDCKGYALFCAGVLDAMKRNEDMHIDWCFRFASYNFLNSTPYHVFTVVNPKQEDIWIDPVLGEFNYHYGYWYKRDRKPKNAQKVGFHWDVFGQPVADPCDSQPGGCTPAQQAQINADAAAALTAAQQAYTDAANKLPFNENQQGLLLPSIPGYPADLPRLQISPSGRLCFYDWPLYVHLPVWTDFKTQAPLAQPLSIMDWNGTWNRVGTEERITQAECNTLSTAYNEGNGPALFNWCTQTGPNSIFKIGKIEMWIMDNIQFYINKYLNNPYRITELIPFGMNWDDQLTNIIQASDKNKLITFLSGCNFLQQPVGTKTFWDKFYEAAPLVISAIAAIVTEGAATPALLLALGNIGIKYGQAKATIDAGTTLPQQGAASVNTAAVQADIDAANPSLSQKLITWVQTHPWWAFAVLGGVAYLIHEQEK